MTELLDKTGKCNVTLISVEQLEPLLIPSTESQSQHKDDFDTSNLQQSASATPITTLQLAGSIKDKHPSLIHTKNEHSNSIHTKDQNPVIHTKDQLPSIVHTKDEHSYLIHSRDEHPSPTHMAELMLSGGLPKNRRRPGPVSDSRVTMTGTITRGDSVGQPVEVHLKLSETELIHLTSQEPAAKGDYKFHCGRTQGPHIFLWSCLCIPVAMVISIWLSFYNGSMTWYNVFIYFSEEKTIFHRIAFCPFIILSFPVTVGLSTLLLSLVATVMQISWSWQRWRVEIRDGEKGFYGWFCDKVGLPRCSPYQVVVLGSSVV